MDVYPKFIIETNDELGDCLIISKCTFHKQLATDPEKVISGGWFSYDSESKSFILYGESHDFGKAKLEDIQRCIKDGNVYSNSRLNRPLTGFSFKYKNESGEIFDL